MEPTQNRLQFFPIAFFAMIMGLAGLSLAWQKAQHVYQLDLGINLPLALVSITIFSLLLLIYLAKALRYRQAVLSELQHPVKLSFFPTISISMILLGTVFLEIFPTLSHSLWLIGSALHLLLLLYVLNTWMHHEHFQIQHMNPAWFIPAVGNVLVPLAGIPLGYHDISWFFFSIGMLFWMILMIIVFYRILFHPPIDARLMPSLFILIAPPAVGFIAYIRLTGGELDSFSRILYFSGAFLTLLLISQIKRFFRLQFALSWWAYTFPTAAITVATFIMYEKTQTAFYQYLSSGLLITLSFIVAFLLFLTFKAVLQKKICVIGH